MIILRIFLYLICIISIGWSVLVFAGPPIIKRVISGYSEGALIPSGVTVSPGLNVSISRLDFIFQNETAGQSIRGFSRATEIAWSIFGEKPFLEINLGPSVVKDYATAESVNFFTPSFQRIDWQNITVVASIDNLALNSFAKMESLTLSGNLNLNSTELSNVNIDAEKFSAGDGGSTYSVEIIRSRLSQLSLNTQIIEQLFSSAFAVEDIVVPGLDLTVPKANLQIVFTQNGKKLKVDFQDVKLSQFGGFIENIKVDGLFNQFNVLQELKVDFGDGLLFNKSPKFPEISARVKKSGDEQYVAQIQGNMEEFEVSSSDNFIGSLPGGAFVIDLQLDSAFSKVTSISKIDFNTLSAANISGTVKMGFRSELLTKLECAILDCELSDFDLAYRINFGDEWVKGSANCAESFCDLAELNHFVRTSNTLNIFTILNQAKILNPLSSLYMYGAISSGQKINSGHELKFQF